MVTYIMSFTVEIPEVACRTEVPQEDRGKSRIICWKRLSEQYQKKPGKNVITKLYE